jgi:hypothetical protein
VCWRKLVASQTALQRASQKESHKDWQQSLTILQVLSASCGVLLLVTFVALPTVQVSASASSAWQVHEVLGNGALYDGSVPLLAATGLEPLLWLIVLASLFVIVAVVLSQDRFPKGLRGMALLLIIASITGFVTLAVWWQGAVHIVNLELVSRGGAVWVCGFLVVALSALARHYKQHSVALKTLMILLLSLTWLGLSLPGASRQLPVLSGYYTWLELARPTTRQIDAEPATLSTVMPTRVDYGGWVLVVVLALLGVLAAAAYQLAGIIQRQRVSTNALVKLSPEQYSQQIPYGRLSRNVHQPQPDSAQLKFSSNVLLQLSPNHVQVWQLAFALSSLILVVMLSLRYLMNPNSALLLQGAALSTQDIVTMIQPEFWQAMASSVWLALPLSLTVQRWLSASLVTIALTVTPTALALLLTWGIYYTRYQERLRRVLSMLKILSIVTLIVYIQLGISPQQSVWILGLFGLSYCLEHPSKPHLTRHLVSYLLQLGVLLGAFTGQGLGGLLVAMLAVKSGLGMGIVVITLLILIALLEARGSNLTNGV